MATATKKKIQEERNEQHIIAQPVLYMPPVYVLCSFGWLIFQAYCTDTHTHAHTKHNESTASTFFFSHVFFLCMKMHGWLMSTASKNKKGKKKHSYLQHSSGQETCVFVCLCYLCRPFAIVAVVYHCVCVTSDAVPCIEAGVSDRQKMHMQCGLNACARAC